MKLPSLYSLSTNHLFSLSSILALDLPSTNSPLPPPCLLPLRMDRVTIREKEAVEKEEEEVEKEKKRHSELRKKESHRVSSFPDPLSECAA